MYKEQVQAKDKKRFDKWGLRVWEEKRMEEKTWYRSYYFPIAEIWHLNLIFKIWAAKQIEL